MADATSSVSLDDLVSTAVDVITGETEQSCGVGRLGQIELPDVRA